MSTFMYSFNAVAPVFLLVIVGCFLQKFGVLNEVFSQMASRYAYLVGFPCLIFKNVIDSDFNQVLNPGLILYIDIGFVAAFALMLVISLFLKYPRSQKSVIVQAGFRSNSMMLGVPIAQNMFGAAGVGLMSISTAFAQPLFNLLCVLTFVIFGTHDGKSTAASMKKAVVDVIQNPLIIASILGILFSGLSIPVPSLAYAAIEDLAAIATPISLLCLGVTFDFKRMLHNLGPSTIGTVCRLILVPFVVVVVAVTMGFRGMALGTILVLFANPASSTSYIMAEMMGGDGELAGEIVLMTVFFSVFTLFGGIYILKALALI